MHVVISFDIVDDRTRYRVARLLEGHAVRVQKSVFECEAMNGAEIAEVRRTIEALIDARTDSVRYYFLCAGCSPRVEISGVTGPSCGGGTRIV